ncbi:hypothetical protein RB195_012134 [Necator americanus]|uniref:Uncharacterized protein n=1 Tax=Necator americanus TaxID=51031 RepID=A0ABR1D6W7_NECAM
MHINILLAKRDCKDFNRLQTATARIRLGERRTHVFLVCIINSPLVAASDAKRSRGGNDCAYPQRQFRNAPKFELCSTRTRRQQRGEK